MSEAPKTALIAGGGLSGLAMAVHLDELGYKVKLLERSPKLGGRTYSFEDKKTGHTIDNGQHLLSGAYEHTLTLLEKVGAKHKLAQFDPFEVPLINTDNSRHAFKVRSGPAPITGLKSLLRYTGFSFKEKLRLLLLGPTLMGDQTKLTEKLGDLTVQEWLQKSKLSNDSIENFWKVLTLATLNDDIDKTSADGLAQVLHGCYFDSPIGPLLLFPKVGLSELFVTPIVNYLKLRGHEIHTSSGIKSIRIMDNKAQGFELSDGTLEKADLYISALPFRALRCTLPQSFKASRPEFSILDDLQGSPIISVNLFFDRPIMPEMFLGSAKTQTHWFFAREHYIKEQHDTYMITGVISGAYDLVDKSKQELVHIAMNDLEELYPNLDRKSLVHSLVNKEREATLSSRPGINAKRPQQKILDNFFCIGDWTKTNLPATIESAVKSAHLATLELQ